MYIIDSYDKQIINSEFVERFCAIEKNDAVLISASYSDARPTVTMGRYQDLKEAQGVLGELVCALAGGQTIFYMPSSLLYAEQITVKDARVKRKGGS